MSVFWLYFFMILPYFLALLGIISWILVLIFNPHKVRIKEMAQGRKTILHFRARDFTDKDGVTWWKLFNEGNPERKYIPVPPSSAIELTNRGKKCVDCYRTETGEIVFIKDTTDGDKFADLQPFTTKQRLILINNVRKAQERRGHSWKEYIPTIAGLGACVIIVLALMVFWGDIAKPVLEAKALDQTNLEIQRENLNIMKEIKQSIQKIEAEQLLMNAQNITIEPPN